MGPALTVDANTPNTPGENPHTFSPLVYGMNGYFLDQNSASIARPGVIRWGGDDISRYNYQNNVTNSADDYYFENFYGAGNMFGGRRVRICISLTLLTACRRTSISQR